MASVSFIPIEVSREMRSREKPLWIGKPVPKRFAIKEGWQTFLNGAFLIALVVYLELEAIESGDMVSILIGVPFAALGLYFISAPVREYWRARRTTYVVSNQRLIILNGLLRPSVESFAPSEIGSLEIDAAGDGSGSLIFQERRDWRGQGGWFARKIGFKTIRHVREAEEHIMKLKGQVSSEATSPDQSRHAVEKYRGYTIERVGDNFRVGKETFVDSASAKAHIDANWARSRQ
jgi:hypothetical protein